MRHAPHEPHDRCAVVSGRDSRSGVATRVRSDRTAIRISDRFGTKTRCACATIGGCVAARTPHCCGFMHCTALLRPCASILWRESAEKPARPSGKPRTTRPHTGAPRNPSIVSRRSTGIHRSATRERPGFACARWMPGAVRRAACRAACRAARDVAVAGGVHRGGRGLPGRDDATAFPFPSAQITTQQCPRDALALRPAPCENPAGCHQRTENAYSGSCHVELLFIANRVNRTEASACANAGVNCPAIPLMHRLS